VSNLPSRANTTFNLLRFSLYLLFRGPRPVAVGSVDVATRLSVIPTHDVPIGRAVEIRWNASQVPFLFAETDRDLAVGLGVVHAHLRLGQMEVMRRIAWGRLSEMVGPAALSLDQTLHILDIGRAVPEIAAMLPAATREWLEGFVAGINHYLARQPVLPHEFAVFDLKREPWSLADILTLQRLYGADFMWLVWQRLLKARDSAQWRNVWRRLMETNVVPMPSGDDGASAELAAGVVGAVNLRSGSNSAAVGSRRGRGDAAWLASDPHLGISLPANWLIAGYRSPSYCAAGLMLPGMPFIAVGRNEWIGWGGTNLHALASELDDISDVPETALARAVRTVRPRWSSHRKIAIRTTGGAPVISDAPLFRSRQRVALRWVGHLPSDEITAMLRVNAAADWGAFQNALDGFAVPGQNMIYGDSAGNIGQLMATRIPADIEAAAADLVGPAGRVWTSFLTARDLPARFNPPIGFVASANDPPAAASPLIGRLFSSRDRIDRIGSVLATAPSIGFSELRGLQQDVCVASARSLARRIATIVAADPARLGSRARNALAVLAGWDGSYHADSRGAALFEVLLHRLARTLYDRETLTAYAATWTLRDLIRADIETADPAILLRRACRALTLAAKSVNGRVWGDLHRLRLGHPLGAVPLAGRRYRYFDLASPGSSETVMKTAHGLTRGRHAVRYGSNARHICNMADPDENYLVLLGGQDGWFGSTTFADQVPLWREGQYIQVPLRTETVMRTFSHVTRLTPRGAAGG
jgi:penicillin amidase